MIMSELETEYWYAVFSFEDIGYISDRDKSDLIPKKLFERVEKSLITHNQARRERGWTSITIHGWEIEPTYNEHSKILEWATVMESDGDEFVNHNIYILGRQGVMVVMLAISADKLDSFLPESIIRKYPDQRTEDTEKTRT